MKNIFVLVARRTTTIATTVDNSKLALIIDGVKRMFGKPTRTAGTAIACISRSPPSWPV